MKPNLSVLLASLFLCTAIQAAPSAEAEAAFENATRMNDATQQWFGEMLERLEQGKIDEQEKPLVVKRVLQAADAFTSELRKASAGEHAVATYILANMQESLKASPGQDRVQRHTEACALYRTAADQGLLAGAVTQLLSCRTDKQRVFPDQEVQRMQDQLLNALEQPDPYAAHYPLPALRSLCFKEIQMPSVDPERPFTSWRNLLSPTPLSLEHFRADGYYLLAVKYHSGPEARDYFKRAQATESQCLDPMNIGAMFEAEDKKSR